MSWLYIAILSHLIFAVVFVADKIIVKKFLSPLRYALIIGGLEGLAALLIPFVDFHFPSFEIMAAAFLSGIFFILGIYFYFKVLLKYEASWVVPFLFGVVVPIATFVFGKIFLGEALGFFQMMSFISLIVGGLILSFGRRYDLRSVFSLLIAGIFISAELVLLKIVFNETNFISGYILSRVGGFLTAFFVLVILYWRSNAKIELSLGDLRHAIFSSFGELAIFKQILAAVGNFILIYAISLGSVTLVNGLGGLRYAFVFLIAALLARKWPKIMDEPLDAWTVIKKSVAICFIVFGVLAILLEPARTPGVKIWGADFTTLYSDELGLDAKEVLDDALDDLNIREFRLAAYWSDIEREKGVYDFSNLDWQIDKIKQRDGKIILAVGERLPRWPECHIPEWAKDISSPAIQFEGTRPHYNKAELFQEALLGYLEATISHYKSNQTIWAWQLENEPFLFGFGECPYVDDELIDKEFELIKKMDDSRPVIITDSGEFGLWFRAYKRADILGTTMYRVVIGKWWPFGYFTYPLDPDFFKTKAKIMEMVFGAKPIINIELQAEPWLEKRPPFVPIDEQLRAFDISQFKENIEYAKEVGFERNYLWGLEWWYWMKENQNHPEFWEEARNLFSN